VVLGQVLAGLAVDGGDMAMEFEAVFFFVLVVSATVGSACYGQLLARLDHPVKIPVKVRHR